eukprot:TRINITY_DN48147_c0_g1_i1.p1 TRINITY_DN48147_c0_g1~~TRINITY_DN48147_c0_g1_i1.p1  ORF type:complete len:1235 (+),score=256.04 TRINITY_DN48147_c0_g1_i1:57-3707(+)
MAEPAALGLGDPPGAPSAGGPQPARAKAQSVASLACPDALGASCVSTASTPGTVPEQRAPAAPQRPGTLAEKLDLVLARLDALAELPQQVAALQRRLEGALGADGTLHVQQPAAAARTASPVPVAATAPMCLSVPGGGAPSSAGDSPTPSLAGVLQRAVSMRRGKSPSGSPSPAADGGVGAQAAITSPLSPVGQASFNHTPNVSPLSPGAGRGSGAVGSRVAGLLSGIVSQRQRAKSIMGPAMAGTGAEAPTAPADKPPPALAAAVSLMRNRSIAPSERSKSVTISPASGAGPAPPGEVQSPAAPSSCGDQGSAAPLVPPAQPAAELPGSVVGACAPPPAAVTVLTSPQLGQAALSEVSFREHSYTASAAPAEHLACSAAPATPEAPAQSDAPAKEESSDGGDEVAELPEAQVRDAPDDGAWAPTAPAPRNMRDMVEQGIAAIAGDEEMQLLQEVMDEASYFELNVSKWMLLPDTRARRVIDTAFMLVAVFEVIYVTLNVTVDAWDQHPGPTVAALFGVITALHCGFIVAEFRTAFLDGWELVGDEVEEVPDVHRHYLHGWFKWDVITSLPYDLVALAAGSVQGFRVAQCLRVTRMFRTPVLFGRSNPLDQSPTWIKFLYFVVYYCVGIHLMACFWLRVVRAEKDPSAGVFDEDGNRTVEDPTEEYVAALYFTVTTMTTVGFGDISAARVNSRAFAIVAMVIGVSVYAYVMANVATFLRNEDMFARQVTEKKRSLASIMNHYRIPLHVQKEAFCIYPAIIERIIANSEETMRELPELLQIKLYHYMKINLVRKVPLFRGSTQECLSATAMACARMLHPPKTFLVEVGDPGEEMFIIVSGVVEVFIVTPQGEHKWLANLKDGSWFGEMSLLFEGTTRTASVRTLTACELLRLSKADYVRILERFPALREIMEREAQARMRTATGAQPTHVPSLDGTYRSDEGATSGTPSTILSDDDYSSGQINFAEQPEKRRRTLQAGEDAGRCRVVPLRDQSAELLTPDHSGSFGTRPLDRGYTVSSEKSTGSLFGLGARQGSNALDGKARSGRGASGEFKRKESNPDRGLGAARARPYRIEPAAGPFSISNQSPGSVPHTFTESPASRSRGSVSSVASPNSMRPGQRRNIRAAVSAAGCDIDAASAGSPITRGNRVKRMAAMRCEPDGRRRSSTASSAAGGFEPSGSPRARAAGKKARFRSGSLNHGLADDILDLQEEEDNDATR